MRIITKILKQKAVYWEPKKVNVYGKKSDCALPIEIKCRWEEERVVRTDEVGREVVHTQTMVYVDRDLKEEGMLMLGVIRDLAGPLPPPPEAKKIRQVEKFPNFKATKFVRIVYL